jgi:hypothetical protein
MKSYRWLYLIALIVFPWLPACGGGNSTSVIQPAEDYQPTSAEKAMQQEMEAARETGRQ